MSFKFGQKIVCVYNEFAPQLSVGEIYTVTWVRPITGGVLLKEVEPHHPYVAFDRTRFRKVDESFAEGVLENILKNTDLENFCPKIFEEITGIKI